MKQMFLLIASFALINLAYVQEKGTVTLYGYYQPVSQGKAPDINAETGLRTSGGQGRNYLLYAVSASRLYPAEVWIKGIRMGVTIKTMAATPVTYGDDANIGSPRKVLVPKTTQRVTQLILTPAVNGKGFGPKPENLAKTNNVVLVYKQRGKFYYNVLASLTALSSVAAQ